MVRLFRSALLVFSFVVLTLGCRKVETGPASTGPEPAGVHARKRESTPPPELRAKGPFAYTNPGELPRLLVAGEADESTLPLKHTDVDARVLGHVAQVRVKQEFHNDREQPIEVTYTFPLPENAAVDDMRMVIGERTIESEVQTREHARQTFEEARREGHTAALLEQERPNIFTQSVTNVAPGETIEVEISYLQTLTQDGGTFEFVFPMVVGPRFIPAGDSVPDAARINPPIVGKGERSGNDVSLTISVDAGAAVSSFDAPTHSIVTSTTTRGFDARLRDAETIPNRDFVLRWEAGGTTANATLFASKPEGKGHGHFALVVQPPQLDLDEVVGRREMIFVVDRSGSMSGLPLALAKQTLRESLSRLRPVDTFDVIGFENGTERLFGTPRPANEHNLVLAERFIDGMEAGGGTMMADAVEAALAPALSRGVHRHVLFLTDGYIGNEQEIFTAARGLVRRAQKSGGRARVFGIGIGSSPNRELIAGLSKAGDGTELYVGNREHPRAAVDGYFRLIDHAVLESIFVDWGGLAVDEVYPEDRLNLFASRSVVIHGRFVGQLPENMVLHARLPGGRRIDLPVTIAAADPGDRILSTLWARAKLSELSAAAWDRALDAETVRDAMTQIGLDYHLVTSYTSLVAVDRSRVVGDGRPMQVTQAVDAPEDVDPEMAGAYVVTSGRDFVSVVELAPTGSNDASGISLAGTTGAEPKYVVDGAAVTNPAYGSVGASIADEFVVEQRRETDTSLPNPIDGRAHWDPDASLRIKDISGSEGVNERAIKRAIQASAIKFEACYEQRVGQPGKLRLRYRVRFDAHGRIIDFELLDGSLEPDAEACMASVLLGVQWDGLPSAGSSIDFELRLRM